MAEVTGLRNNALPYPVYGAPYGLTYPILDADGDLVPGAAGLDAEISKNGDTFADCTNEGTEIATSSGMYYLLLTATELTTDVATIIQKTSTSGAKTTPMVLYPRKLVTIRSGTAAGGAAGSITLDSGASTLDDYYNGMLCVGTLDSTVEARIITDYTGSTKVAAVTPNWNTTPDSDDTFVIYLPEGVQVPTGNTIAWNGTVVATPATAGIPDVNAKNWNNLTTVALPLVPTTAGRTLDVSAGGEAGIDWANIGSPTTTVNLSGTSTLALEPTTAGRKLDVSAGGEAGLDWANIGSPTTAQNLSATNIDVDQVVASVSGAVASVTGNVGGNVTGSVGSVVGAVGSVTGNVGGTINGLTATALADFFDTDSGKVFGDAVGGSVVKEIADNATVSGTVDANVLSISGDSAAADALESILDGGGGTITAGIVGNITGNLSGSVGSVTGNVGGNVAGSVASVTGNLGGNVAGSVGSVTGNVGGNVAGSVGSVASGGIAAASFAAGAIDATAIASNAIAAAKIASGAITAAKFAASAIDAAALATDAVDEIRDAIFARAFSAAYNGLTFDEIVKILVASQGGKTDGGATTTFHIRSLDDSQNTVTATVDADGNRTAVTLNP